MDEFAAALAQLKVFNRMVAEDPVLSARLIEGEYDFLQWQQAKLFVAFRERHRKMSRSDSTASVAKGAPSLGSKISFVVSGLSACAMSLWAVWLRRRPDVLLFSVDKISADKDHDFRIDGLYRFLDDRRLAFTEVFHARGKTMLAHARSRRRTAVYHEALEFMATLWFSRCRCRIEARRLAAALPCEAFEEAERPFIRSLAERLLKGIPSSLFKIRWYRRALKRLRPRLILGIDDTRYYHELCAAARAEDVPFYAFQHGFFTKYHAGWLSAGRERRNDLRSDALFVWSPYWKKELLRLGTNFREDEIRIGGNPKGDGPTAAASAAASPPTEGKIGLLVPFESDAPPEEMQAITKAVLATGRVKIWLKTRPDWDVNEQLRRYGLEGLHVDQAEAASDHRPILDRVHAVAGVYSTFLYDVLPSMRPIFIFKTSMDFGEGMLINGLADPLDTSEPHLAERLIALCADAAPKLKDRLERYQGGAGRLTETLEALTREAMKRPSSRA